VTTLALHPGFIEKLHWGAKIAGLIEQAWRAKAPKALQ
jgi:hypothetical protein